MGEIVGGDRSVVVGCLMRSIELNGIELNYIELNCNEM